MHSSFKWFLETFIQLVWDKTLLFYGLWFHSLMLMKHKIQQAWDITLRIIWKGVWLRERERRRERYCPFTSSLPECSQQIWLGQDKIGSQELCVTLLWRWQGVRIWALTCCLPGALIINWIDTGLMVVVEAGLNLRHLDMGCRCSKQWLTYCATSWFMHKFELKD